MRHSVRFGNLFTTTSMLAIAAAGVPLDRASALASPVPCNTSAHGGSCASVSVTGASFTGVIVHTGTISAINTVSRLTSTNIAAIGLYINASAFTGGLTNTGTISAFASASTSSGNASAGAIGIDFLSPTVSASFGNSGLISATAEVTVFGTLDPHANATGIVVSTTVFPGGFSNGGTIDATASASGFGSAGADAIGIYVAGSSFQNGLTNTGTISASANATSTHTYANAYATGISLTPSTFSGGITNTGVITATAMATASGNGTFANADAYAYGIQIRATEFSGGVTNGGTITAIANAYSGGEGVYADATGIHINVTSFDGGVTNSGVISASATAVNSRDIYEAQAYAAGIDFSGGTFSGGITNSGMISASASASATDTRVYASAIGIYLNATSAAGDISNSGTITAYAVSDSTYRAEAGAIGIDIIVPTLSSNVTNSGLISTFASANVSAGSEVSRVHSTGIYLSVNGSTGYAGNIVNTSTGIISAVASGTATSGEVYDLYAKGIYAYAYSFGGAVTNAGTISAQAAAFGSNDTIDDVGAYGVEVYSEYMISGFTNSGSITASVTASNHTGTIDNVYAFGVTLGSSTITGAVTNSGLIASNISVSGTGTGISSVGDIYAYGLGVDGYGLISGTVSNGASGTISSTIIASIGSGDISYVRSTGVVIYGSSFTGAISNAGMISSTISASATLGTVEDLYSGGLGVYASTFVGSIVNSGLITGNVSVDPVGATVEYVYASAIGSFGYNFSGTLANAAGGTLAASASAVLNTGTIEDVFVGGIDLDYSTFSGTIANAGNIEALASVSATTGTIRSIGAYGIDAFLGTFSGTITNTGLIAATLNASTTGTGHSTIGDLYAYGVYLDSGTFSGSFGNGATGTISSALTVTSSNGDISYAESTGVLIDAGTFFGTISNAGTIEAAISATATIGGVSDIYAGGLTAFGSTFSGTIANSGLITAAATAAAGTDSDVYQIRAEGLYVGFDTFSGGIFNTGTILATASGTAGTSAHVLAHGIEISVNQFTGVVSNGGTVEAIVTAATLGTAGASTTVNVQGIANGINFNVDTFSGSIVNTGLISASATSSLAGTVAYTSSGESEGFFALATGLHINGSSSTTYTLAPYTSAYTGGLQNTGTIAATATLSGTISFGPNTTSGSSTGGNVNLVAGAVGLGIGTPTLTGGSGTVTFGGSALSLTNINLTYSSIGTFSGGIGNTGVISATALNTVTASLTGNTHNVAAIAGAVGIAVGATSFSGGIVNSGSILVSATSSPTINVNGSGINVNVAAIAGGIVVYGSEFAGGITNSGTINVQATATPTFSNAGSNNFLVGAVAAGIDIVESSYSGGIANSGSIIVDATAGSSLVSEALTSQVHPAFSSLASSIGFAGAVGIFINTATFAGALTNSGSILVHAAGATAAEAFGIWVEGAGPGQIFNSGTISATLDASSFTTTAGSNLLFGRAIDLSNATTTTEIDQNGGLIQGDIRLSNRVQGDTVNVNGGITRYDIPFSLGMPGGITGGLNADIYGGSDFGTPSVSIGASLIAHDGLLATGDVANGEAVNINTTFLYGATGPISAGNYTIENVQSVNVAANSLFLLTPSVQLANIGTYTNSAGAVLGFQIYAGGVGTDPAFITNSQNAAVAPTVSASVGNIGTSANFLVVPLVSPPTPNFNPLDPAPVVNPADKYPNSFTYYNVLNWNTGTVPLGAVPSTTPLLTFALVTDANPLYGYANSEDLVLTRVPFQNVPGLGPNGGSVATYIEGLYDGNNDLGVIDQLFGLNGPQYTTSVNSLAGQNNVQNLLPITDVWREFDQSILKRLYSDGTYNPGAVGSVMGGNFQIASADGTLHMADAGGGMTGGGGSPQASGWLRGYGIFTNASATVNGSKFDQNVGGVMGGFDMPVADNLLLGGAFNYGHGSLTDQDGSGHNTQDQYQFALYGRYRSGPWYVAGSAGGGGLDISSSRVVYFPIERLTASSSPSGDTYNFNGEVGYDMPQGDWTLTPLAGFTYTHVDIDSFTETGAGVADLTVNSMSNDSAQSSLGGRIRTVIATSEVGKLVPELRAVWQHEFADQAQSATESFANMTGVGSTFTVVGSKFSRDSGVVGAGISGDVNDNVKLFLDYDVKLNGDYTSQSVSGGLKVNF